MGILLLFASGKGGVGKTTLSIALAQALSRRGSVLLIDTDCGIRSHDLFLGTAEAAVFDLSDVLSGRAELTQAVCTVSPSFSSLLAPQEPFSAADNSSLAEHCAEWSRQFDFLILDRPAGLDFSLEALLPPAEILLTLTPDEISLRAAVSAADRLAACSDHHCRLLINRFSYKRKKKQTVPDFDQYMDLTGLPLLGVIPEGLPPDAGAIARVCDRLCGKPVPLADLTRF